LLEVNPYLGTVINRYQTQDSIEISSVHYRDENHYALVSYGNKIIIKWGNFEDKLSSENGLVSDEIYGVESLENNIYLATDQGLQILSIEDETYKSTILREGDGLVDFIITNLKVINGKLWFSDFMKSVSYLDKNNKPTHFLFESSSKINEIITNRGDVFVSREDGMYILQDEILRKIFPQSGSVKVNAMAFDEEDNIWFTSSTHPLMKGNVIFKNYEITPSKIQAISKVNQSVIYGTKEGLYKYTDGTTTKISSDNITCLSYHENVLWVGTYANGVKLYDNQLRLITSKKKWKDDVGESVLYIYHHDGKASVSSLTGIVEFVIDRQSKKITEVETLTSKIGQSYTYSMLTVNDESYFGSDRQGISIYNSRNNGDVRTIKKMASGEKIGSVYSMASDSNDKVWFTSTSQGLGYISGDEAYKAANLPNVLDNYTSIISLSNDNLMLVRANSVDIYDPINGNFLSFDIEVGTSKKTQFLNNFDVIDDKVLFAHENNIFEYGVPLDPKSNPEVLIDAMMVNLNKTSKSKFAEDQNNVQFHFTGSWLTAPEKINYQYKLEGLDEDWRFTKDRIISYPRLDPGKYTFNIRASNNDEFANVIPASKSFQIKRYFYNTGLFRLGALLLLGFLVWKWRSHLEKQRSAKTLLEKQNIENQLINLQNQLNPHFLFNSFNTLIGLIEEDPERGIMFTEKMTDFFRIMLELGKKEMIPLSEENVLVGLYVAILKERFNDSFDVVNNIKDYTYSIPPLSLQVLIENAVKHNLMSKSEPIIIDISQTGSQLIISNNVKPKHNKEKGTRTGLKNIVKRFELNGLKRPEINKNDNTFSIKLNLKPV